MRVVSPVLSAAAEHRLRRDFPVEQKTAGGDRVKFTHLEAVARTLSGVAPFVELGEDDEARRVGRWAVEGIVNCFEPASPDLLDFSFGGQTIVDAAFLAEAFLRSPKVLWGGLDRKTQERVVAAMVALRKFVPAYNNWLLFASVTEAFLKSVGEAPDPMRVEFALRQMEQWYVGGGFYKDGISFHLDYYNSFVIHPMVLETAEVFAPGTPWMAALLPDWRKRAQRYAEYLERQVAADGSYPATGRSIAYRCGAFHLLAMLAWRGWLPESLSVSGGGQARAALTAVIERTLDAADTFDANGFLRIGLSGHQPGLGEGYISTGSLYLCTAAFLPLGLPGTHAFWTGPEVPTTWQKAWGGVDLAADHD